MENNEVGHLCKSVFIHGCKCYVYPTFSPLYVQLPNFISQSWSSKGNQVMSIWHVDLKIPSTKMNLEGRIIFFLTWRDISADAPTCDHNIGGVSSIKSLRCWVVHQDVRGPDEGGWHPDISNVAILWLIPPEVVINPFLKVKIVSDTMFHQDAEWQI